MTDIERKTAHRLIAKSEVLLEVLGEIQDLNLSVEQIKIVLLAKSKAYNEAVSKITGSKYEPKEVHN